MQTTHCIRTFKMLRHLLRRHYVSVTSQIPRVAIIGSGPAGFYTAQQILKGHSSATVDIYEKLPVPFGLVRFGVAPDHPEVKNVINTFTQTARHERCCFHGNVTVGRDVTIQQLRDAYTAVVMAYGADDDKRFGLPGEDLNGVVSARAFVGWYNGLPEHKNLKVDLTNTDTAVVFGQGNVAIDVARILLTPVDILKTTDITDFALESLSRSRVNRVLLVGRRGPLQVAFTTAELREMVKLPKTIPHLHMEDFQAFQDKTKELPRPRRRLTELMVKTAMNPPSPPDGATNLRSWELRFLRSPLEFIPDDSTVSNLSAVKLAVNRLQGQPENQWAEPTGEHEVIQCGLAFRSIGYRSVPLENSQTFDSKLALIPNQFGRVRGQPGLYCSGWVKRGPVGVIASTMNDGFETGKALVEDLSSGTLCVEEQHTGHTRIKALLEEKGVRPVSFTEWDKIDEYEVKQGENIGKPREKIVDTKQFLEIAHY